MANTIKFEIHQVENLYQNLSNICQLYRRDFPAFHQVKMFRLYIPRYAILALENYSLNKYRVPNQFIFEEGKSEFEGIPIYYNIVNEISAGPLDFHFPGLEGKTFVMKNFFEDKPEITKI